jgi:hypothetical protein
MNILINILLGTSLIALTICAFGLIIGALTFTIKFIREEIL